jgi:hypothetical protein
MKNRKPLQVSPVFKDKLDDLYRRLWGKGKKPSYRQLTEDIVTNPLFDDIEKQILNGNELNFDIKIKMDKRWLK